jgi:CDGSH-type Zn-finger protein
MDKPHIADTKPAVCELEAGRKYAYCTCGLAKEQPYCDGSHAGTGFRPQIFEVLETCRSALCRCKYTREAPYCDGSHKLYKD